MRRLAINAIEWKDTEKYMQMMSLKSKFITWIIGYREKTNMKQKEVLFMLYYIDKNWYHLIKEYLQ